MTHRPILLSLDSDTIAALETARSTAASARVPLNPPTPHGWTRSSMVRFIVRDWERRGGLRALQAAYIAGADLGATQ